MTKALITIDDELWTRARLHNVRHGLTVNQLITVALTHYLADTTPNAALIQSVELPKDVDAAQAMIRYLKAHPASEEDPGVTPASIKHDPGFGHSLPAPKPTRKK